MELIHPDIVKESSAYLAVAFGACFMQSIVRYYTMRREGYPRHRTDALLFTSILLGSLFSAFLWVFCLSSPPIQAYLDMRPWWEEFVLLFRGGMMVSLFGLVRLWTRDSYGERRWLELFALTLLGGTVLNVALH